MSPEMLSALTLSATIPGLFRRCSPAFLYGTPFIIHRPPMLDDQPGAYDAWVLDLTDITGRLHASIWLAETAWKLRGVRSAAVLWFNGSFWLAIVYDGGQTRRPIDGLGDIEHLDGTLMLPDGSRWIEAEALRRGVVHAAKVLDPRVAGAAHG